MSEVRPMSELTPEERAEFDAGMSVAHTLMMASIKDFYVTLAKKVNKAIQRNKAFPPPQHFWQEVGGALIDNLMVNYPLPDGTSTFTSNRKGYLVPAEFLALGVMWSCYRAGLNLGEFREYLDRMVEKSGTLARNEFVGWFDEMTRQKSGG